MCETHKYVAMGGMIFLKQALGITPSQLKWFVDEAHKRGAKMHGLGVTSDKLLRAIKYDSVDSSPWLQTSRFGNISYFDGKKIRNKPRPKGMRMGKRKEYEIGKHNYYEWIKYQKYAKEHL